MTNLSIRSTQSRWEGDLQSERDDDSECQRDDDSRNLERGKLQSITVKLNEQGTTITALKTTVLELEGDIENLKVEIVSLKGEITRQGDEIVSLKGDFLEERREKACKEIAFGIQDVILETNSIVKKKGLSWVFKSLQNSRHDKAHLFRHEDPPDTVIYKKAAFIRILENSNCLKDDLDSEGITSDVIAVVLDVLKNELQNVTLITPERAEVTKVDKFFKNTLRTLEKKCIKDL